MHSKILIRLIKCKGINNFGPQYRMQDDLIANKCQLLMSRALERLTIAWEDDIRRGIKKRQLINYI